MAKSQMRQGAGYAFEDFFMEEAVQPGTRFFYFVSLEQEYNGINSKQYATRAMRALSSAYQDTTIEMQQQDYNQILQDILQVLEGFQKYEAQNEYEVFKGQLEPLLKKFPTLYEQFASTFQDNRIDYIRFMALLKILNQDITVARHELSNLETHMRTFDQEYKIALDQAVELARKKAKENGALEPIDRYNLNLQTRAEQVEQARFKMNYQISDMEEFLSNGLHRMKLLHAKSGQEKLDMKQVENIVQRMLKLGVTAYGYKDIRSQFSRVNSEHILFEFIGDLQRQAQARGKEFSEYIRRLVSELDMSLNAVSVDPSLEFLKSLSSQQGGSQYDNGQRLITSLVNCIKHADIIDEEYAQIEKIFNGSKKITQSKMNWGASGATYAGLTKKRREAILHALSRLKGVNVDALMELEDLERKTNAEKKEERFDIRRKKDFDQYIKLIRQALGKTEKFSLTKLIAILEDFIKTSEAATRKQLITITSETGAALDWGKMLETAIVRMGQDNFREDSIQIGVAKYAYEEADSSKLTSEVEAILHDIDGVKKELLNTRRSSVYKEIKRDNARNKRKANEYDVTSTLRASQHGDEVIKKEIEKKFNITDLEKMREILSHIFVIEESDKFATTFNTAEYGFKGGSLGAGLEAQVKNINDMLTLGGITPMDSQFLINAIMNAGPGMLGYHQKDRLEMYLSSIAAICMFTSGAQSLQDYALSVKQKAEEMPLSTKKIHIFNVGTLYVPLSYVLHLIHIGLEKAINMIGPLSYQQYAGGGKVTIFNPVNEATDKVSKTYVSPHGKLYHVGDWYATAEKGLPKVTLNMAILGSYLDVLDSINEVLRQVFV